MSERSALLVDELYRAARAAPLPQWLADDPGEPPGDLPTAPVRTWGDLLFLAIDDATGQPATDDPTRGHTHRLADPGEKSQALLAAVLERHAQLVEHAETLPGRAREWYVTTRLGLGRLPSVPDTVVVVAEAEPDGPGVALPAGTPLRAGKNLAGEDRLYETATALTVTRATVLGLRAHDTSSGVDTVARVDGALTERLDPFPGAGFTASRDLVVFSPLLAFGWHTSNDTATVRLRFADVVAEHAGALADLEWWYSGEQGEWQADADRPVPVQDGTAVLTLHLGGTRGRSCAPGRYGGRSGCYVRAAVPAAAEARAAMDVLSFSAVTVQVKRSGVLPDGAAYNDGQLDVRKELRPFGEVPRAGDSFAVRCEEALSKPLASLQIRLQRVAGPDDVAEPVTYPAATREVLKAYILRLSAEKRRGFFADADAERAFTTDFIAYAEGVGERRARLVWQRWDGGGWTSIGAPVRRLGTLSSTELGGPGTPTSEPLEIAGVRGRHVRLLLREGDFGWEAYLANLARLAAKAAGATGSPPTAGDLTPPLPPVVADIVIGYTTHVEPAERVLARNGIVLAERGGDKRPAFPRRPFAEPEGEGPRPGVLVVGLDLDERFLGRQVSLAVGVDGATACDSLDDTASITWEYRTAEETWASLPVVDGTRSLRQDGVVRFIAPPDWGVGAPELEEADGRWLRALVAAPATAGALTWVLPDAVEARYRLSPTLGTDDPTPASPLPAGAVKGLLAQVAGIRKATNPVASRGGRGPEPLDELFPRTGRWSRHRDRAITVLDVEDLVRASFPEVALVRALPHTSPTSANAPGWISVVVVPRGDEHQPLPTVELAGRIRALLDAAGTPHLRVAVRCPAYVPVRIAAKVVLRPGALAGEASEELARRIDRHLHPLSGDRGPDPFGRTLHRSDLIRLIEADEAVDFVEQLVIVEPPGGPERVEPDPVRGIVVSAGRHAITALEAL